MKTPIILFSLLLLSACGGGSSSSGNSGADQAVTQCIDISTRRIVEIATTQYTNTCDFAVSLGYKSPGLINGPFTLQPNQTHAQFLGSTTEFIACRLPSQATNKGDTVNLVLDCT